MQYTTPIFSLTNKISSFILDTLFPKHCLSCGKERFSLCQACETLLDPFAFVLCPVCFKKIPQGTICAPCRKKSGLRLARFFAALPYRNPLVRSIIHAAKYEPWYAKELLADTTDILARFLRRNQLGRIAEQSKRNVLCIPIPLHATKLRKRGFNQAEIIAFVIAKEFAIPVEINNLKRVRETRPQTEVAREERRSNIYGAFALANPEIVKRKVVILVDDVYTSGSTMNECARVLKNAGAKEVWGITLAM